MSVRRTVFMFSGQGSQYFHMGRVLHERSDAFRAELDRLVLTAVSIYMVECALAWVVIEAGVTPDLALGVSGGSFAGAVVAGALESRLTPHIVLGLR